MSKQGSRLKELCVAMQDLLNSKRFTCEFVAERANFPSYETETSKLRVTVFPGPRATTLEGRHSDKVIYTVYVAMQAKTNDLKDTDQLLDCQDEIEKVVRSEGKLGDLPYAGFSDQDVSREPFNPQAMEQGDVFLSVTGFDYLEYVDV